MANRLVRWLVSALRALLVGCVLLLLLLQTYGLYIAAALTPHQVWRKQLNFRLRRTVFAMERVRLGGAE
jgi:hypothetical protein